MTRWLLLLMLYSVPFFGQQQEDTKILNAILLNYYKNEKVIYKGRNQLLFLYCEKVNNNEQILETANTLKLPKATIAAIKSEMLSDVAVETWSADLETIYTSDKSSLKTKINKCLSLDEYLNHYKKPNLNNQRLMIISKPILYSNGNMALVKVVFYRTIEHNNGSVLRLEKVGDEWHIKEYLNEWST
ncbi:MAG TPA: hypothetical protein VF581_03020 [Flavobacterium sp.]|jgi:hypothetical protein